LDRPTLIAPDPIVAFQRGEAENPDHDRNAANTATERTGGQGRIEGVPWS
jgi:hypothetical protein